MAGARSVAGVADDSITALLAEVCEGNREIESRLIPHICNESRSAAYCMRLERVNYPRQLSALVNEAFFGGLSFVEIALALYISERTAKRELSIAKTWLKRELSGEL